MVCAYACTSALALDNTNTPEESQDQPQPAHVHSLDTTQRSDTKDTAFDLIDGSMIVVTRVRKPFNLQVDGHIDDEVWSQLPTHGEFLISDPDTLEPAPLDTSIRLFYTDDGLYIAVDMEQDPTTLITRLSAKDQGYLTRDYISVMLDTSGQGRYGFFFQLSLGDSRSDGTIQPEREFSMSWDGPWLGGTATTETGWSAEFFIPWQIVNMPKTSGDRIMAIKAMRKVASVDEVYGWPALPWTQPKFLSAFQPLLLRDVRPKQQLSFFPYASTTHLQIEGEEFRKAGVDLFWRPSTNFQITATANPDFGTVEADRIVINHTAIETFFPEKRLFFLEGQDIFIATDRSGGYSGDSALILLHSRRIGQRPVFPDIPAGASFDWSEFNKSTDLQVATKATGQIGAFRYGMLAAVEEDTVFRGEDVEGNPMKIKQQGRQYGTMRMLYERSNGDYRGIGFMSTVVEHPTNRAKTYGVDGHFLSSSGKWNLESQVVGSDVDDQENGYGGFFDATYIPSQGISHQFGFDYFDDRLDINDLGYLGRNDESSLRYRFRLRKSNIGGFREISSRVSMGASKNSNNDLISAGTYLSQEFTFQNLTEIRVSYGYSPETIDDRNSFGNGSFRREADHNVGLRYESNNTKPFYYTLRLNWQTDNMDGNSYSTSNSLILRPSSRMTAFVNLGYSTRDGWLLFRGDNRFVLYETDSWSPQAGLQFFFTANQYCRLDLQWRGIKAYGTSIYRLPDNETELVLDDNHALASDDFAISRLVLQARYRWEFSPMSDVFLVYTKNASLPNPLNQSFSKAFIETFDHPVSEQVVVKLRHRLGS